MSSPMYEIPEHFPMPLNADGQGPAEPAETVRVVCWCGDEACERFRS